MLLSQFHDNLELLNSIIACEAVSKFSHFLVFDIHNYEIKNEINMLKNLRYYSAFFFYFHLKTVKAWSNNHHIFHSKQIMWK